jgi:DNA repair protein RadA/Sms
MNDIITTEEKSRIQVPFSAEVNRVLGGGLVVGSVTLCAGEPGIGKSTLFMQLASSVASSSSSSSVVYVSGEENKEQIALRAKRLGLSVKDIYLICDIDVDTIIQSVLDLPRKPTLIIVDSVQTMRLESCAGSAGSVSQIKESTMRFVQLAKTSDIPVICLGHVTKSGQSIRYCEYVSYTVIFVIGGAFVVIYIASVLHIY